ncbi:uncharacterized protein zgc:113263 [Nematolebias whitei]|uniref:uncharacterized protein zgc:113263 n=1 Tax=Nematolebias whitei TaxID=451745 RepID=UPI00189C1D5D|nr:uncharacterized protein zgc:113263 [Nematolebias whitei]
MDNCILSSLSLPPGSRHVTDAGSSSPTPKDSTLPEPKGLVSPPIITSDPERPNTRSSDSARQRLKQERDSGSRSLRGKDRNVQNSTKARHETIDLTVSNEAADTDSEESNLSLSAPRRLRKRKLSGGVDVPAKKPVEASAFLDSSVDGENSSESPLISIWGEYTDSQERAFPVAVDSKVPWSDDETLHLLDIWGKDSVQRALKGCLKNRHIFTQIAQKMAERGHMRTVEQCQTRIKRLKKCFRRSNRGNSRQDHKFYSKLEQILSSSAAPEVSYDVEEVIDEDESQDGDEDLQFIGQTGQLEIGTRSVPWTDLETLALINIWGADKMQLDLRGVNRTGHIFSTISSQLASLGFSRTPEQCQTRLKRLKSGFRQCYQNNLKGQEQVRCKFYNELGRILVKDFESLMQLDEMSLEAEEFPPYQEMESTVGVQEDRKKVPWSDKETIILLEIWGDTQVQQGLRRYPHNGHIFSEVSEKLNANGFSRTPEQCHTRIKRLKSNYRQCKETMSSSGTDRVDFKFYDLLEQILEKQPSTSSTVVTDSIEISEDSNQESVAETDAETRESRERAASGSWSEEETLALIEIWGEEDVQKALGGFIHNDNVYDEISERLHDFGFSKTPEQCCSKIESLRVNFQQCYEKKKCGRKVDYKFYQHLEEILGQEATSIDEYDEQNEQADPDPGVADAVNAPWTDEETISLVEVWAADDVQHSLKTCVRNGHIFAEIAEKMATLGYLRTAEQCQIRIRRLKKAYRRYCNNRRNGGQPTAFRYFNLLAPVLGDDLLFTDADSSAADATLEHILEADPALYEQPSTSHLLTDMSRKMPWSDLETRTLLELWGEDDVQLTLRGCLKNRHVFDYISEKMGNHGFIRTTEQCYTRIKRLKYGFVHEKAEFKFFREMDKIFRKELRVDDSAAETSFGVEDDDCASELSQVKGSTASGNQWVSDNPKLAWGDRETETLLDIWGSEEIQENVKSSAKNKHIYKQISQAMASQGYLRTSEQCQSRIKRLRANFRHFLEGRQGEKQECKFFDQMLQIFGNKYVMNSESLADDAPEVIES